MMNEYGSSTSSEFEGQQEESEVKCQGHSNNLTWRRRAKSLCDVTWEPICILKFLSEDCIYCEKKVIVTQLQLQKVKVSKKSGSGDDTEESSADNGIEIIRSVQIQPSGDGSNGSQNGTGDSEHVCKPSKKDASYPIVIPVSIATVKPSSNLPSWGLLPPVEESEDENSVEVEKEAEVPQSHKSEIEKEIKCDILFEIQAEDEEEKNDESEEEEEEREKSPEDETDLLDYSSEANDEILTRAYEVINENDDLLTALDKLEHHIIDGSDPLAEETNLEIREETDEPQSQKTEHSSDKSTGVQLKGNKSETEVKDEFGFVKETTEVQETESKEKEKCDGKLIKSVKSTSSTKCDITQKSKVKINVKQKEGNRLIRALNWVSKLPGRISSDKQTKKQEAKAEKQEKQEEVKEVGSEDDYGFFVKLDSRPLSERQNQALKKLSQRDEKSDETKEVTKDETTQDEEAADTTIVTEVLSSFQPQVEDTHFQDNLRRFDNISLTDEQKNGVTSELNQDADNVHSANDDDEWEPGPRQTGSLPNLAGEFLSTSPTMERIREYMMQDDSDDSSLDEFLLIPMPTDFEETVGSAVAEQQQQSKLNSTDVYDSEENSCESDRITSPNQCSGLASDTDEKLPDASLHIENVSPEEDIPVSKENHARRLPPLAVGTGGPAGVMGYKNQTNVPIPSAGRSKRGSSGGVIPRAIRGAHQTPPYATPPRPIKGHLQVPRGRGVVPRGTSREGSYLSTRGRGGLPLRTGGVGRGVVTHTGLYEQKVFGQFTDESRGSGNKCSVKDKLNNAHGSGPSQHVAMGKSNPPCPRLSQQPGSTPSRGSIGFHQEQQHYIASHKPTNIHTVNSRAIHKAAFNRPSGYGARGGIRGSTSNRGPDLQKHGKSNISFITRSSSGTRGTEAGENSTPVRTDLDQSGPAQVRYSAGDPGAVQRVQAHITLLPGGTPTHTGTDQHQQRRPHQHQPQQAHSPSLVTHSHLIANVTPQPHQLQQRPLVAQAVSRSSGSGLETTQDGGNWMDSGVQMDFTDEG